MAENEKQAVQAKKDKTNKPGFFARVGKWFRDMKSELKKVQWPSWKDTWKNTLTVIACVILVGIFLWVFDLAARWIVGALLDLAVSLKG